VVISKNNEVGMWHTWRNRKMDGPTELWYEDLKENENFVQSGIDWNI
jgi:hypothetical protein